MNASDFHQTGIGYAERRERWLALADDRLEVVREHIEGHRFGIAASVAREAAEALDKAAGEHEFYLRVQP